MTLGIRNYSQLSYDGDGVTPTFNVTVPSGLASGDLLLAMLGQGNASTAGSVGGSGWTSLLSFDGDNEWGDFWRKIEGTPPANYTLTVSNNSSSNDATGTLIAVQDVHPTTPINATPTTANGDSTTPTSADITTTVSNCLVIAMFIVDRQYCDSTMAVLGSGWTKLASRSASEDTGNNANSVGWFVAYKAMPTAGAAGQASFVMSSADSWSSVTIAIAPVEGDASPKILSVCIY